MLSLNHRAINDTIRVSVLHAYTPSALRSAIAPSYPQRLAIIHTRSILSKIAALAKEGIEGDLLI